MSIVQPESLLGFTHKFFIAIFLFRLSFGFGISFASYMDNPNQTFAVFLAVVAVMIYFWISQKFRPDSLYTISLLFILAGYLSTLVFLNHNSSLFGISNTLLIAGSELFDVLIWMVLSRAGRQNMLSSIFIIAWGRMCAFLAVLVGANIGYFITNFGDIFIANVAIALIIFLFVCINMILFKNFSFERTISSIQQYQELDIKELVLENFDNKITEIEKLYSLTPRESEVYSLLVKGRNAGYVNEELGISINTVKTHVSNIYKKLDVHSQQELIDQFEELEVV